MSGFAYLFPGQGAQAVGMGKAFYDRFEESRELYKRAATHVGFDVAALCFEGPQEELTKTEKCQPALFVTSLAAFAAFQRVAPQIRVVGGAGLSLGELTALAAAEAMTFRDALHVVQARAEAMTACALRHPGAMLAVIGLSNDVIREICQQAEVVAANFNAADQVVLSGTVPAIEEAERLAKAQGATRAVRLDVSGAFHSPLMREASEKFRKVLEKVRITTPRFPVISNVTGKPIEGAEAIRELLPKQMVSPVLWESSMRGMIAAGAAVFVEFPPARVLTALLRRIDRSVKGIAAHEPADFDALS